MTVTTKSLSLLDSDNPTLSLAQKQNTASHGSFDDHFLPSAKDEGFTVSA